MTRRFAHLFASLWLALILAAIGPISQVFACSCMQLQPGQALGMSQVAFTGVVAQVQNPPSGPEVGSADPVIYTFVVENSLKGEPGDAVLLETSRDSASCGVNFAVGDRWTVYASIGESGTLQTNLCAGNELVASGVPVPAVPGDSSGLPMQLLVVAGATVVLGGAAAYIFLRRPRSTEVTE